MATLDRSRPLRHLFLACLAALLLAACGTDANEEQCTDFALNLIAIDLERNGTMAPEALAKARETREKALGAVVEKCQEKMSAAQAECGAGAKDMAALKECR